MSMHTPCRDVCRLHILRREDINHDKAVIRMGYSCAGYGVGGGAAFVLVLFILLVIILAWGIV